MVISIGIDTVSDGMRQAHHCETEAPEDDSAFWLGHTHSGWAGCAFVVL